jgi:Protein tyrosine and serine/threonine kinase
VETYWLRTSDQLTLLRHIANLLDERHQINQRETLLVLASKLQIANDSLKSVFQLTKNNASSQPASFKVKKLKYLFLKESIDRSMEDLKLWLDIFDPSWYLIMKAATPQIDDELKRFESPNHTILPSAHSLRAALKISETKTTIFLQEDGLGSFPISHIPFSSATLAERPGTGNNLILDRIACPRGIDSSISRKAIAALATKLSYSDPATFSLLQCKGVIVHNSISDDQIPAFTLVLRIPKYYYQPQSLRDYLLRQDTNHSLSDRFLLAKNLVKSIGYIHNFGFVHKNIRPETILIFKTSTSTIGSVSLVGFENFRTEDGRTLHSGDNSWEKNLYRHPVRQGQNPTDEYIMQHDIYSLGVCLLEIGLWSSFVNYAEDRLTCQPASALGLPTESSKLQKTVVTKDQLVSMARIVLPQRMGNSYAEIVETCLTCLDDDNADFGNEDEFLDEDGIRIGVRYIEKVSFHP